MMKLYLVLRNVFVVGLMLVSFHGFAQQTVRVSGNVTSSDDGTSLPGVSILEKGTSNGTVSDAQGNYTITIDANATLVFSFVGYTTQEVVLGGRTTINIVLESDVTALNEVVVVGYGEQEKKDVTGVVSAVNSENFNKGAIVSPDQLITGKIAGVQITQNSGEPGGQSTIRIRGGTSLNASNEPLYVIDGVPIDNAPFNPGGFSSGRNPLNFINPNDIESFTVLKDASAAAIYGSRAANGVIIITTKKGKTGAPTISYDGWYSVGQISNQIEVFNATQYREVIAAKAPAQLDRLGGANTDWQDEIYQTATGQNHAVTISGGTEKTNYRASVGYQDQNGIVKMSNTKRTSFGMSLSQQLLDDDLNISVNVKGAQTKDVFSAEVVGAAMEMDPTQPIYDETSPWGGYFVWKNEAGQYERLATINPVSSLNMIKDNGSTARSLGNIQLDYEVPVVPGLSANVNLGYDIARGDRKRFQPNNYIGVAADTGEVKIENYSRSSRLFEAYAKYKKDFQSFNFDVTAGYSWQNWMSEYPSLRATRLTDNSYGVYNPSVAKKVEAFNSALENRLISFFGRANLGFKDRYLLTASIRRDGSTRFGPANRWGTFVSAAAAWRIIEEDFMTEARNTFSDLKLRVGFGVNGQQDGIGDFGYLATYSPSTSTAQYQIGDEFVTTIRPNGYDRNLKWEETTSYNIGLDFGVLNGRVSGSIDYYNKNTADLLFERAVPAGSNLTNIILSNIGEIRNQGVELTLNTVAIDRGDLQWNIAFNAAFNKNEIIALDGDDDPSFKGYETGGISGGVGNNIQILKVGKPAYSFYVYKQKYVDGKPAVNTVDYNDDGTINLADMYEDVTGDGVVNDQDRRPFQQRAPKVLLGLTSNLTYKDFDLSFTLRSNLGGYMYNNVASNTANLSRANDNFAPRNMVTSVLETNFTQPQYFSDYYIEKADFLRMDNVTLGYTASKLIDNKAKLRVYATVQNPFIMTEYSGLDPEVPSGIDNNIYPRSRTFIFGLNLGF